MSFLGAQNSIALGVQGLIHIDTGGGAGGSADYLLAKSLRFRSSASAYLNRIPTATGSRTTFTWSGWVKRGALGTGSGNRRAIFSSGRTDGSPQNGLVFRFFDDQINASSGGGVSLSLTSTAVYRDPAAWYHLVFAVDTTQGTASNRVKIYVNGAQVTSFGTATYPSASQSFDINTSSYNAYNGAENDTATLVYFFDGEMAEINFVDGQALAPTAFGASSTYNQWLPKKYAGTYGTNGFYLPFTNTASTSTLVADSSGNGNNWTPNNISLTAGSTYDSLTDVPTLTSTTVANYAVLNPLDSANPALSINGNLSWVNAAASHLGIRGSIAIPASGAFYMECVTGSTTNNTSAVAFGLGASTVSLTATLSGQANLYQLWAALGGYIYNGATVISSSLGAFSAGDVMQIAVDVTNTKMWLGKNNVWYNSSGGTTGNPSTGANPTFTTSMVGLFPTTGAYANSVNANFGQQPFTYTPPSGFLPLNTFNIAAGTVTTSGTFTGNASTDGPMVYLNGTPTAMTINGNAVTFGTHADKLANGFKVRSSSASYNTAGSNTYVATTVGAVFKYEDAQSNP